MSFDIAGILPVDESLPGEPRAFDVSYTEEDGWSDPAALIILFMAAQLPLTPDVLWQPIPQPRLYTEPTLTGSDTQVASTVVAILTNHDVPFSIDYSSPPSVATLADDAVN